MKVGCLHSNPQVDQHLCRFNAVSLDRDSRHNGPDASEHFAPDLPGIVSSTPRIGHLGTGKCPAYGIHYLTTHGFTLGLVVYGIGATSFAERVGFLQINQSDRRRYCLVITIYRTSVTPSLLASMCQQ